MSILRGFVIGYDFSRAGKAYKIHRTLAPEGPLPCPLRSIEAAFRKLTNAIVLGTSVIQRASLIGVIFSLFQTTLPAQTATDVAKRVDDHYNRLQSLKANFTEQYDGLGMRRAESGVLLLRKPGRMRWDYASTAGKVFVLDGKFGWFYAPGDSQVQRLSASQLDDLRSPLRFLLGHTKIESELEGLKLAPAAAGGFLLTGVPKGLQKRIAKLSLTVTPDGAIERIQIEEADGAQTVFDFKDEQANPAIPDSAFHFTPPTGIPVVDALPPV